MDDTVYKWSNTVDQLHFGTLFKIAAFVLINMLLDDILFLFYLSLAFKQTVYFLLVMFFPHIQRVKEFVIRKSFVISATHDAKGNQ